MSHKYSTLSAAIRAGSKLAPQAFGHYQHDGGTCALGAAISVIGSGNIAWQLIEKFPYLGNNNKCSKCPSCPNVRSGLFSIITHLNDVHRWSREAIADFVEEWENEHLGYETLAETTESEVMPSEPPATLLLQQEAALQG